MRRLICGMALVLSSNLWAQTASMGGAGVAAKVGTLGLGGELTVGLTSRLNLRAGFNAASLDWTVKMDEADLDGTLVLQTFPVLLDWHPAASGFRFSAGAVVNNNELEATADPDEPIELDGRDYVVESFDGDITFSNLGLYLGLGYGNAVSRDGRWSFSCDFGLMYHGQPEVSATAVTSSAPGYVERGVVPKSQAQLDAALAAEVEELEEDLSRLVVYPVVSLGVSYRF